MTNTHIRSDIVIDKSDLVVDIKHLHVLATGRYNDFELQTRYEDVMYYLCFLKREYKQVIGYRYLYGLSTQRIAEKMNISEKTVDKWVHRAIERVLKRLEKDNEKIYNTNKTLGEQYA